MIQLLQKRKALFPVMLSIQTFLYGMYILIHPHFLNVEGPFGFVINVLDDMWMGGIFVTLGVLYAYSSVEQKFKLKQISAVATFTLWSFYFFSFFTRELLGSQNSAWLLILTILMFMYYELRTGDYR